MEIKFYGGNCIKITSKKNSIVVDDSSKIGLKSIVTDKDIYLLTDKRVADRADKAYFSIDSPGEYEVADVSIHGVPARAHIDMEKTSNATMYRVIVDDVRIAIVGHIHPDLTEDQLEDLGTIDVLIVPIGGNGYTLDGVGAQKVIRKIEPKVIIPTHYDNKSLNFEVPQASLTDALSALAMEPAETLDSFKIKNGDVGEGPRLIVLNQS